jgi:hypothetical protein
MTVALAGVAELAEAEVQEKVEDEAVAKVAELAEAEVQEKVEDEAVVELWVQLKEVLRRPSSEPYLSCH